MPSMPAHVEHVEMAGHIVDSLLLPKVLDAILSRGGRYHIEKPHPRPSGRTTPASPASGWRPTSPARSSTPFWPTSTPTGPSRPSPADAVTAAADKPGCFPDGFYCSTNFRTEVRVGGVWVPVQLQEMDCGIVVEGASARCVPMTQVKAGDRVLVGRAGTRVFPPEGETRKHELFEFMASPVSSERPKAVSVREIAKAMRKCKADGLKVLAVLGPAVVHTGGGELVAKLVRDGLIDVLFAGNALATHDLEQSLLRHQPGRQFRPRPADGRGARAPPAEHQHGAAVGRHRGGTVASRGGCKSGIMYECVTEGGAGGAVAAASGTTARCRR